MIENTYNLRLDHRYALLNNLPDIPNNQYRKII